MKKTIIIIVLLISFKMSSQEKILFPDAKFKTGDYPEWKNNDFDDIIPSHGVLLIKGFKK